MTSVAPVNVQEVGLYEPYFGALKYQDLPDRTYPTMADLEAAVAAAFERTEARLRKRRPLKSRHHLRPAA